MIEVTNLDSTFSSKQSVKERRATHDPTAFAKKLEDVSSKSDSRRKITGKMADKPEKGEGRKTWAHERSRTGHKADQMQDTDRKISEVNDDLDQTDQEEAVKSGHSLLMWLHDMPEVLHDLAGLSLEEDMVISENDVKNLLLWIQSMTEVDNMPDELNALAEKLTAWLKDLYHMVPTNITPELKAELQSFLSQADSLLETLPKVIAEVNSTENEVLTSNAAAEVISENAPADTAKVKEAAVKQEVEGIKESTIIQDQVIKDVTSSLKDDQSKEKGFTFQEKPDIITHEQSREAVIPFSLTQIETLLQQNLMTTGLAQEETQLQQNVLHQIVDKIQVIHGTAQSFVSLHLSPEHLGKLTIQLISDMQQGMTAKIYAETPQAKEMIESNFGQLKDALSGKGVNLTAMEVFVGQDPESSEKQREFQFQQARAQRRRGSRIAKVPSQESTALINEVQLSNNPYVLTEGFDQLG